MLKSFLYALFAGTLAALLCVHLNTPLPWMTGPLFATAALRLAGADLRVPVQAREAGQWAIGTALGLYFTAPVLAVLAARAGWIAVAVVFALALGCFCAWLLRKLSRTDHATAFFAMALGGASEMAVHGERHGANVERVAAAHSLRLMLVVGTIPFAIQYWGRHGLGIGTDLYIPGARAIDYPGLLALVCATACAALPLKRLRVPNAWVIGPLAMALLLTACGIHLSRLPEWMVRLGQLLIGVSLGTRFSPGFLRTAPRYMASVLACSAAALALAAGFGLLLAEAAGLNPGTAILATSPGGIAEMSLTAQTLHLGVPVVTAFHVSRMVILVLAVGPLFRRLRRTN
ncbi:AbrB family transcriptional regulator [Pseudoduganella namucuonensis]|uniref:AbrB family transcriptional regulator n=1 Tax=Pseudoduganella namucuonensis TaxID=1035707 RepID=A0A1I7IX80_9BURK|nr:AbrB family transcriptional regulator [Pseudoduganella namucuonensis]SFU77441.1 hypothetical protein SAMN05216552_1009116 [Pseudoduganella namucuonensis]